MRILVLACTCLLAVIPVQAGAQAAGDRAGPTPTGTATKVAAPVSAPRRVAAETTRRLDQGSSTTPTTRAGTAVPTSAAAPEVDSTRTSITIAPTARGLSAGRQATRGTGAKTVTTYRPVNTNMEGAAP